MAQREVEVILARQLASHLTIPIFVVDPAGRLIYFNEPAERLIARRFDETEELPLEEWTAMILPSDAEGQPLLHEDRPIVVALEQHRPAHSRLWITDRSGNRLPIEVTAFPITGQSGRDLGAVALFWGTEP